MSLIYLDPGHGKETPGKRSFDGSLREYEFNRDVTNRIARYLMGHGMQVKITCTDDQDIGLATRCKAVNQSNADIFVSIHANAYGDTWNTASGWEIFCYKKGGEAEKLAKAIHKESIPYLGLKDRGIKEATFYVIKNTKMPAVLIEHGFYTNREENEKLKDKEFREKCAIADAKGILKYFGVAWIGDEMVEEKEEEKEMKPSSWAQEAWTWAKEKGITDGSKPQETCTREQVIAMLYRALK